MGGNGRNEKGPNVTIGFQPRISMTLREESSGKKHGKVNATTMCKMDHLKDIALWAATEACVPSLSAFLGERLAATTDALNLQADSSLFICGSELPDCSCENCESILQPGSNCTVRIEKNKSRTQHRRRKKSHLTTQNNVVYRCHFCSHQNLMRGTPKGYLREICPAKAKPPLKLETFESAVEGHPSSGKATISVGGEATNINTIPLPTLHGQNIETSSPATPLPTSGLSLLDSKKRKRNRSNAKKVAETETSSTAGDAEKSKHGSGKRRKKSWTSLKEIAESGANENSKKLTSFTVPFLFDI
ncbi:hypothetical protein OROGR_005681 [Orobanche gracilis]